MNLKSVVVGVVAAVAISAVPAGAQQGGGGTAPAGTVKFQGNGNLAPRDMVVQAQQGLLRMEAAASAISRQLGVARAQRDVVKTLCLNDKLSQVDVAIRAAKERYNGLKAATLRNDVELAGHEFTIHTVLRQRSDQLVAEANQCIGEEAGFVGQTNVTPSIDPTIPDVTPENPTDPSLITDVPPCTSCIQ